MLQAGQSKGMRDLCHIMLDPDVVHFVCAAMEHGTPAMRQWIEKICDLGTQAADAVRRAQAREQPSSAQPVSEP